MATRSLYFHYKNDHTTRDNEINFDNRGVLLISANIVGAGWVWSFIEGTPDIKEYRTEQDAYDAAKNYFNNLIGHGFITEFEHCDY